jgi:hypothetical protein
MDTVIRRAINVKVVLRASTAIKPLGRPQINVKVVPLVGTEIKPRGRPQINVKVVPLVGTDPVGPLPILVPADVPRANILGAERRVVQTALRASTDPVGPVLMLAAAIVTLVGTEVKRGKKQQTAMVLVPRANIRLLARPRVRGVPLVGSKARQDRARVRSASPANTNTTPDVPGVIPVHPVNIRARPNSGSASLVS